MTVPVPAALRRTLARDGQVKVVLRVVSGGRRHGLPALLVRN